jgi:hypothetical protein
VPDIDDILGQVAQISVAQPVDAQNRMQSLLSTMGPAELRVWEPDLRNTINTFLPKRRRELTDLLEQLLRARDQQRVGTNGPHRMTAAATRELIQELELDLQDLSDKHIFQWPTFYWDYLGRFFEEFIDKSAVIDIRPASEAVRQAIAKHTRDIFAKGYRHTTQYDTHEYAITKSLSGLQRFIDLPLEFYSARLSADLAQSDAMALRYLTSGMLCGIIEGYARLVFTGSSASHILSAYARSWAHVLVFMTAEHAQATLAVIEQGDVRDGAHAAIIPFARAMDRLAETATDYIPLPALSQFVWPQRRLDISLRPPPFAPDRRPIQVQCYLDPNYVAADLLTEAANSGVGAIVAPLRADIRDFVANAKRLSDITVAVLGEPDTEDESSDHIVQVLENIIYRRRSSTVAGQSIMYNFAREFPLSNPFLARYYHVYRTSVRDLLRTFERRNGVRLWCSVRRSGKTTAGFDLGTTTGESNVITQTCDSTGQVSGGSLLYDEICAALTRGEQLPNDFFPQAINRCLPAGHTPERRTVLVLDEYETLFGQLSTAVDEHLRLRYTVVQPLLNQMVAFTSENLIVFLGQQPNAHYILMDQNQLSAYVQQDTFPLFTHGPSPDQQEFTQLLRKILSNRVHFDKSFADRVFVETSGHPYLTVNMMVDFVDWLIKTKRPLASFTASDISAFAQTMFRRSNITVSKEYSFFRDAAIRQALSSRGKRRNPWLYSVYRILRSIGLENPDSFVCTRDEFSELVTQLGMEDVGITPDYLLTTGTQANFFTYSERSVAPRVRLLARIAAVSTPEVNA